MGLPAYRRLSRSDFRHKVKSAYHLQSPCQICPRRCGSLRNRGQVHFCTTGGLARVASYGPHMGEEDLLRGRRGSGTVFFAGCNLGCVFCQNAGISRDAQGSSREVTARDLARIMLYLEEKGCHNVNLVSPTHVIAPALAALFLAAREGLSLPLVYNSGGYDSSGVLGIMDGVVDIYMPDMKFYRTRSALRLAGASDYPQVNQKAVVEMHRQVGPLEVDDQGLARKGLLIRHLVLPGHVEETRSILEFVARELGPGTAVNVMGQYRPHYRAGGYPPLDRPLSRKEHAEAVELARDLDLWVID